MKTQFPFYTGKGTRDEKLPPVELPPSPRARLTAPSGYRPEKGLVDAANVALLLQQPLLLTGEPGTGKTQFAYSLAWELGYGAPLRFQTKSTSDAHELFYYYDTFRRLEAIYASRTARDLAVSAESGDDAGKDAESALGFHSVLPYIRYGALGQAVLFSREPGEVQEFLPEEEHPGKRRSVVLIDEVDKAPRDFPNDILNELENLNFKVPEISNEPVEADDKLQPVIIITSNSEKDLPDAFLRRCIYYDISFPDRAELLKIVTNRLGIRTQNEDNTERPFIAEALDFFLEELRSPTNALIKQPATAELLGWMLSLIEIAGDSENPLDDEDLSRKTLGTLVKTKGDQDKAKKILKEWREKRKQQAPSN